MSNRSFTDEEIEMLRENQYTYAVTYSSLYLTIEFKKLFYDEYVAGKQPKDILEDHGYPAEVLGESRIEGITSSIKRQAKDGTFKEGVYAMGTRPASSNTALEEQVRQLTAKVTYLEQEMEFLKKISSVTGSGK